MIFAFINNFKIEKIEESEDLDAIELERCRWQHIIQLDGFDPMPKLGWLFENGILVSNLPDVTPRQIRQALILSGVPMASIDAALNTLPEPTRSLAITEWEYSIAFKRNRDLVKQVGIMLGWTSEQLDELWALAGRL